MNFRKPNHKTVNHFNIQTTINYCTKILLSVLFLVLLSVKIHGQGNKILSPVIIDTNAAINDLRALSMFLAVKELNVLAITTSDGILSPEEAGNKVNACFDIDFLKLVEKVNTEYAQTIVNVHYTAFIYENDTITLSLKEKYRKQIQKDINDGIVKYGMQTDGYWKLIRSLGIKYWQDWSRDELFEISLY